MVRHPSSTRLDTLAGWTAIGLAALALVGCGGSGNSGGSTVGSNGAAAGPAPCDPVDPGTFSECGTLLIGITDADGDIVSYSVDVLSLTLERADGSTVEALPATTRVDFAELTDVSELISAVVLPPGIFVGATIRVDYADAEVYVEADGDIVAADVVAANGNPLGVVDLRVQLANDGRVAVTRARTVFLSIDFDLAASHSVDTTVVPARITAEPFITAEVRPVAEKEIRVRGALVSVDVLRHSYDIRMLPWHRRVGDHGPVTVHTTTETHFEIGEATYTGDAGLEALAALAPQSLTAAFGTLDLADRSFTASIVLARDSVDGNGIDAVRGNIVARSGNLLTVKGAWASHRNDRPRFRRTVFVEVGPSTQVFKVTDRAGTYSDDDLSVGQRIVAFGEFRDMPDGLAPDVAPVLDATSGRVRMHVTHLLGRVIGLVAGQVTMELRSIDGLSAALYDFSGTGMTPDLDADPNAYEIATDTLPLAALTVDRAARIHGFVTPFGMAPPDFQGRTIVGPRDLRSALGISWLPPGTTAPFLRMGPDGLVPDLGNPQLGARHHLLIGGTVLDLLDLQASPSIEPTSERAWYSLHEPGHVEMFADFAAFVDALTARLNDSSSVRSFVAYGLYDDADNRLTARNVVVFTSPVQ